MAPREQHFSAVHSRATCLLDLIAVVHTQAGSAAKNQDSLFHLVSCAVLTLAPPRSKPASLLASNFSLSFSKQKTAMYLASKVLLMILSSNRDITAAVANYYMYMWLPV